LWVHFVLRRSIQTLTKRFILLKMKYQLYFALKCGYWLYMSIICCTVHNDVTSGKKTFIISCT
jgi:hypothetical protein